MGIFIITGPSGSGKTHLIHEITLLGIYPLEVYTDRSRRPSEKQTTDRVYLTKEEFNSDINEFIYWFEFQGNRYGYKKSDIKRQNELGKSICFNIPPTFLPFMLEELPEAIVIYLNVEEKNFPMLFNRMLKRDLAKHDNERLRKTKIEKIEKRLNYARKELRRMAKMRKTALQNSSSRIFNISGNTTLYQKIIPYIKSLI